MDFQMLKRRDLQSLCKLNNIPANLSNAAMAHSLSLLPQVQGLEDFMKDSEATEDPGSPEASVITSSGAVRTSTSQKVTKQEVEGSKMATRTRCSTRVRAAETKTPATRTTRKRASQEAATAQKQTQKDLQANFEADMDLSEVSDNSGVLGALTETSEADASGVSAESGPKKEVDEVVSDVQQVSEVGDSKENLENVDAVKEIQEEANEMFNISQKVDFHNFSRRDLQSLCKKNKIPANTTNATMADALESLEIVEGLEDVLKQCNSPTGSEMTSSHARRGWTSRKPTKEPTSSKMITKSCRVSRRKVIEEAAREKIALTEAPEDVCSVESVHERESQTDNEVVSIESAVKQSGEGELSAIEREINLQFPAEVLDFGSEAANSNGNRGNTENVEQLEDSKDKAVADIVDCISGSEFSEQQPNMDTQTDKNTYEVSNLDGSEDAEDVNEGTTAAREVPSEAEFEHGTEASKLENVDEVTNSEGSDSDSGAFGDADFEHVSEVPAEAEFEHGSEASKLENVDEVTNTEGSDSDSGAFGDDNFEHDSEDVNEGTTAAREVPSEAEFEHGSEASKLENVDEVTNSEGSDSDSGAFGDADFEHVSEVPAETEFEHGSEASKLENVDEVTNTEGSDSDSGAFGDADFERGSEASKVEIVDEGANTEGSDSGVFGDAVLASEPVDVCLIEKLEAVQDQLTENFDSDLIIPANQPPTSEHNAETEIVMTSSDSDAQLFPIEQIKSNIVEQTAEHEMFTKTDSGSTVVTDHYDVKGEKTPLDKKSIRQLKKMLKEKLQATVLLANKMENLTLEENVNSLAKVEEAVEEECEYLEDKSEISEDVAEQVHSEDDLEDSEADFGVDAAELYPVENVLDDSIPEDTVTGHITIEVKQEMINDICMSVTPSKTPMSVGRMNNDSIVNKENIDNSASNTKSASGKVASAMSIGKLKKALLQYSEKKRPALHARSDNYNSLASP